MYSSAILSRKSTAIGEKPPESSTMNWKPCQNTQDTDFIYSIHIENYFGEWLIQLSKFHDDTGTLLCTNATVHVLKANKDVSSQY